MLEENGILVYEDYIEQADSYINKGCTIIYIAIDYGFSGYIVLSDTIRSESKDMIKALTELKVQPVYLPVITKMQQKRLLDRSVLRKFMQTVCQKIK